MSQIAVKGGAGGTATSTLQSTPGITTDRTCTLPDADTTLAGLSANQTFTAPQKAAVTTTSSLSLSMSTANDFYSTPTAGGTLTFTSLAVGQRGCILLNNTANYGISLGSELDADVSLSTVISSTGKYWLNYWCYDGTNVAISYSSALV